MFSDAGSTPAASTSLRLKRSVKEDCHGVARKGKAGLSNHHTYNNSLQLRLGKPMMRRSPSGRSRTIKSSN